MHSKQYLAIRQYILKNKYKDGYYVGCRDKNKNITKLANWFQFKASALNWVKKQGELAAVYRVWKNNYGHLAMYLAEDITIGPELKLLMKKDRSSFLDIITDEDAE